MAAAIFSSGSTQFTPAVAMAEPGHRGKKGVLLRDHQTPRRGSKRHPAPLFIRHLPDFVPACLYHTYGLACLIGLKRLPWPSFLIPR